jgi:hypothetical protein
MVASTFLVLILVDTLIMGSDRALVHVLGTFHFSAADSEFIKGVGRPAV